MRHHGENKNCEKAICGFIEGVMWGTVFLARCSHFLFDGCLATSLQHKKEVTAPVVRNKEPKSH